MQGNVNIPDSTITSALTFRNLVLMNMQQLTNFPYIEKDFDALTDYELLCLVVKYLNDVIDNQNEQNDSITNMYNAFLALQTYVNETKDTLEDAFNNLDDYVRNYFDNLDVQEEINNKLDDMLDDGTLQEIIYTFLQSNVAWTFNNVAAMKSATNFVNGSYAQTLGFYSINDGGASLYKIRTKGESEIPDESLIIALSDSTLVAELVYNLPLNVRQAGLTEDIDCASLLQNLIDNDIENLYFPKGQYEISQKITTKHVYWTLDNNAEIKATDTMSCMISINKNASERTKNMYIKGGIFNGNSYATSCLGLNKSQYFRFEDIFITNFLSNGIEFDEDSYAGDSGGTFVKNCVFWGISDNLTENGINLKTNSDCHITDCAFKDCKTALYIRGGDIKVVGCHAWCNSETKYIGSKFADIAGAGRTSYDHCVIDTMQYGIYGGNTIIFTSLLNTIFMNRSAYGENNIPTLIYSETSYNNYSGINLCGLLISSNTGKVNIVSNSLLSQKDYLNRQNYQGLFDYPVESNITVLNNPTNTIDYNFKTSSASQLTQSSNFDTLTQSFYQLNMYTGTGGTNIPGTDFTGILYNIVNDSTNNDKCNGFQLVFTSTGKIISRYKKANSWTAWNTFNKDS